ncbi:MAG: motility protein A, partial [Planctomycetota bacterium]
MDLNTVIGGAFAFILVLGAMAIGPGGVAVFIHIPSMIIVFGGTTAVTMLAFPVSDLKPVIKIMLVAAMRKTSTPTDEIDRIVDFANLARKEGLLALETKLQTVDDPFFAKGIQLVIDGFSADTVRDIMELEAEWEDARHATG